MQNNETEPDFYFNEEGMMVMTETYLLRRGYCCGNGCKHCPYKYEAVPEPRRSVLLLQKGNDALSSNDKPD